MPRKVICANAINIQLHGSCDSSEQAYGACLYITSTDHHDNTFCHLCSSSKVAPLKKLTIPRLELCAAVLLAKLFKRVLQALNGMIHAFYLDRFINCPDMDSRPINTMENLCGQQSCFHTGRNLICQMATCTITRQPCGSHFKRSRSNDIGNIHVVVERPRLDYQRPIHLACNRPQHSNSGSWSKKCAHSTQPRWRLYTKVLESQQTPASHCILQAICLQL